MSNFATFKSAYNNAVNATNHHTDQAADFSAFNTTVNYSNIATFFAAK
jgi:hypothetical protein